MSFKRMSAHKYGNLSKTCELHGSHRSGLERSVCALLQLRMRAGEFREILGEVHKLICGPEGHACNYKQKIESVVDFKCIRPDDSVLWVEAKGFANDKWPMKRRLWIHNVKEPLEIWGGTAARPVLQEVLNA